MHHLVPALPRRLRRAGLTLVELMVVVAIVALLTAIVLPSYRQSVYRSRRSDAMTALTTMQQAQERWRGNNPSYQSVLASLPHPGDASTSPAGFYTLSIVTDSVTSSGYTARATAVSGGKQGGDSGCQVFEVQLAGGGVTYRSFASGGTANGTPDPCWVQ